ncbi:MAG: ribosomal protein S18-alanine N-acetyltransferase [Brachymonas sp.]
MSALPSPPLSAWESLQPLEAYFEPMRMGALTDVMLAERAAYPWPWSEGNINDSIHHGHCCQALRTGSELLGYYIAMKGVEEVHLLNITVAPAFQKQGWARVLLDHLVDWSVRQQSKWLWLEVRVSKARAIAVYERYGFRRVGQRKGYYPLDGAQREDALVMNYAVAS